MGELIFFLGLEVKQSHDGTLIHQEKYFQDMLRKFQMIECKAASVTFAAQSPISTDPEGKPVYRHHYRSMIGSLLYLTASRPEIMFVVYYCARYQTNPKESHEIVVKRNFRYQKGSPMLGLWYPKASSIDLVTYSNSDHGGCQLDRKSMSGGYQYLGHCLVSWKCMKQTSVSISSAEAEYITASSCCYQFLWI
ncbi:hypothetical protein L1987_18781 [Smallanthus sonchifolius]|uniref:Uncharacterized protein n=1 Tax=Smallanthus sonchifolius TaxID=185202 RepID=A0ACB9J1H5_9ASTR|nr:hypothetical protein L1987_18781 [Smallanthus sonchifolius]